MVTSGNKDENLSDNDDQLLSEVKESVDYLALYFQIPLEAKGVVIASLLDEVEDAVECARRYLDIPRTEYQKVWYKLHCCPTEVILLRCCDRIVVVRLLYIKKNLSTLKIKFWGGRRSRRNERAAIQQ